MKKQFKLEKKMIAQVRYYEILHVIRDEKGETIFTGSEELAKKLIKILKHEAAAKKGGRK